MVRGCIGFLLGLACMLPCYPAGAPAAVSPSYTPQFPRDFGSHPGTGVEWWYVTGWLQDASGESLGFQITFFRVRETSAQSNPSAWAAHDLLIAHCALSDPSHGRLWQDQRVRRIGLGLVNAAADDTHVWMDDWRLQRAGGRYLADLVAEDFGLQLEFVPTQPPLLNGVNGYSQKGPDPASASEYYSEPHLSVSGSVARGERRDRVSGEAWLDHEWTSQYLAPGAVGWDWVGLNLDHGAALMAFRIRDAHGGTLWAGASLRTADGASQSFGPKDIQFTPLRRWYSPRTHIDYPVSWDVRIGSHSWQLQPLMDDQENDSRTSSGAVYWEGAVRAQSAHDAGGRGYLELTGYGTPLQLP